MGCAGIPHTLVYGVKRPSDFDQDFKNKKHGAFPMAEGVRGPQLSLVCILIYRSLAFPEVLGGIKVNRVISGMLLAVILCRS